MNSHHLDHISLQFVGETPDRKTVKRLENHEDIHRALQELNEAQQISESLREQVLARFSELRDQSESLPFAFNYEITANAQEVEENGDGTYVVSITGETLDEQEKVYMSLLETATWLKREIETRLERKASQLKKALTSESGRIQNHLQSLVKQDGRADHSISTKEVMNILKDSQTDEEAQAQLFSLILDEDKASEKLTKVWNSNEIRRMKWIRKGRAGDGQRELLFMKTDLDNLKAAFLQESSSKSINKLIAILYTQYGRSESLPRTVDRLTNIQEWVGKQLKVTLNSEQPVSEDSHLPFQRVQQTDRQLLKVRYTTEEKALEKALNRITKRAKKMSPNGIETLETDQGTRISIISSDFDQPTDRYFRFRHHDVDYILCKALPNSLFSVQGGRNKKKELSLTDFPIFRVDKGNVVVPIGHGEENKNSRSLRVLIELNEIAHHTFPEDMPREEQFFSTEIGIITLFIENITADGSPQRSHQPNLEPREKPDSHQNVPFHMRKNIICPRKNDLDVFKAANGNLTKIRSISTPEEDENTQLSVFEFKSFSFSHGDFVDEYSQLKLNGECFLVIYLNKGAIHFFNRKSHSGGWIVFRFHPDDNYLEKYATISKDPYIKSIGYVGFFGTNLKKTPLQGDEMTKSSTGALAFLEWKKNHDHSVRHKVQLWLKKKWLLWNQSDSQE